MSIDERILQAADSVGEYLQERKGISLARILWSTLFLELCTRNLWILYLAIELRSNYFTFGMVMIAILVIITTPVTIMAGIKLKEYRKDFDRMDEGDRGAMESYLKKALLTRMLKPWSRKMAFYFLIIVGTFNIAPFIIFPFTDPASVPPLKIVDFIAVSYFICVMVHEYAECIIPKVPKVKKEFKLVHSEARY